MLTSLTALQMSKFGNVMRMKATVPSDIFWIDSVPSSGDELPLK